MSELDIRAVTAADVDAVVALWNRGGVGLGQDLDRAEITVKLDHDGDLFLVGEADGVVVASVMGTYDGHRGRIKRCVVDPATQGSGFGRSLVQELERRFVARGITELRLEVWSDNTGAAAFWDSMGWEHLDAIRYYSRSLEP